MPDFPKPTDGPSPTDGPGPGPSKTCYNCGYKCSDMVRKYHTENATYPYPTGKSRSIWARNGHSDNKFPDHCLFIVQILLNIWDQTFTYQTKHVNDLFLFCYLLSTAATARQNQSTRRARWEIWWWERNIFFSKPGWQNELYRFLSVEIVRQWRVIPNSVGVRVRCWFLWFDFCPSRNLLVF